MVTDQSILGGVRVYLGYLENEESFDKELIPLINLALSILKDVGVGDRSVMVEDSTTTYTDFLGDITDTPEYISAITFVNLKIKTLFDPSTSATVSEAFNNTCTEILWRLQTMS